MVEPQAILASITSTRKIDLGGRLGCQIQVMESILECRWIQSSSWRSRDHLDGIRRHQVVLGGLVEGRRLSCDGCCWCCWVAKLCV